MYYCTDQRATKGQPSGVKWKVNKEEGMKFVLIITVKV